jgi:hypothetical protein
MRTPHFTTYSDLPREEVKALNRAVVASDEGHYDEALVALEELTSDARPGRQQEAVIRLRAEVEYWRD